MGESFRREDSELYQKRSCSGFHGRFRGCNRVTPGCLFSSQGLALVQSQDRMKCWWWEFMHLLNPNRNKNGECLACNPKQPEIFFWMASENPAPVVLSRQDMTTFRKFRYASGWMVIKKHFTPEIRSFWRRIPILSHPPGPMVHASFKRNLHPKGKKKLPKKRPHCSLLAPPKLGTKNVWDVAWLWHLP